MDPMGTNPNHSQPGSCKNHVAQVEDVPKLRLRLRWHQRGFHTKIRTHQGAKDLHFDGNPKNLGKTGAPQSGAP